MVRVEVLEASKGNGQASKQRGQAHKPKKLSGSPGSLPLVRSLRPSGGKSRDTSVEQQEGSRDKAHGSVKRLHKAVASSDSSPILSGGVKRPRPAAVVKPGVSVKSTPSPGVKRTVSKSTGGGARGANGGAGRGQPRAVVGPPGRQVSNGVADGSQVSKSKEQAGGAALDEPSLGRKGDPPSSGNKKQQKQKLAPPSLVPGPLTAAPPVAGGKGRAVKAGVVGGVSGGGGAGEAGGAVGAGVGGKGGGGVRELGAALACGVRFRDMEPKLSEPTLEVLDSMGFERATPVQAATIPLILRHKDVATDAVTGSGKTLAFVVPTVEILRRMAEPLHKHQVGAVIISPTRELASQIFRVAAPFFASLAKATVGGGEEGREGEAAGGGGSGGGAGRAGGGGMGGACAAAGGGVGCGGGCGEGEGGGGECGGGDSGEAGGYDGEVSDAGLPEVGGADPGRGGPAAGHGVPALALGHHAAAAQAETHGALLSHADGGAGGAGEGGHEEPRPRGSADRGAGKGGGGGAKEAGDVSVEGAGAGAVFSKTPSTLKIEYAICSAEDKPRQLAAFLAERAREGCKFIVYFLTCACVDYWGTVLPLLASTGGAVTFPLHGKMKQRQREKTLSEFAAAAAGGLLCTDVAARGLDIPGVDWILQYDPPQDPNTFVHRVGRTARMGQSGNALAFLLPQEDAYVEFLRLRKVPIEERQLDSEVADTVAEMRAAAAADRDVMQKGLRSFVSFVRGYREHLLHFIFKIKELELGRLAMGFGLLQLPSMPELKRGKRHALHFQPAEGVDVARIPFKDKTREKQRLELAALDEKPIKKREAARAERARKKHVPEALEAEREGTGKHKRLRSELQRRLREEEELNADYSMLRKLKRGKINEKMFSKAVGADGNESGEDSEGGS